MGPGDTTDPIASADLASRVEDLRDLSRTQGEDA